MYLLRKARPLHGRIDFNGLQISIETGRSRCREWKNTHDGSQGMSLMRLPYGYILGTVGVDAPDHVDCFVGQDREAPEVYVIHTLKAPEFAEYDEDKCFLGLRSPEEAQKAFFASYNDPRFFGSMSVWPFEEFKEKVLTTKGEKLEKSQLDLFRDYNPEAHHAAYNRTDSRTGKLVHVEAKGTITHTEEDPSLGHDFYIDKYKEIARKWGASTAKERARSFSASAFLGREFGETADQFYARQPKLGRLHHWIVAGFPGIVENPTPLRKSGEAYCKQLGDKLGVDWKVVDLDEFCDGMFEEEEHKDITGGDPMKTAKIVLAHLKEDRHYYSKLATLNMAKALKARAGIFY